ncbi:hypothetical protein ARMGADRAFT_1048597 [Armillaria gallica]|uniref:ATP-dependent DNA helicase n=1 Tax=Armillaria gallica TaxID=47427 RepID=A0A2H3CU98_ARMGA|nr:hypothetical protein ARMGADRAFT_1048597 [Armillaria gallica]
MCTNNADIPFGGMNIIFAGDFVQLPPVIGAENAALYRQDNGIYVTNKKSQVAALITMVVILIANSAKMKTALVNMRYKMCTAANIGFLCTRICNVSDHAPDTTLSAFYNVSIITGLNVHKDEFNCIDSSRFSMETSQVLTDFYLDNIISEAPTTTARSRKQHNTCGLLARMQCLFKLLLCKGLPIMIRLNAATELCITKGQEGTVHLWVEGIGNCGQRVLETLFVHLSKLPKDIKFNNLLPNVVPLTRTLSAILCSLPDDSSISINRSQVHQLYYTMLSCSIMADGTLLLPDFTNPRWPAFDPWKIQGGCSRHL